MVLLCVGWLMQKNKILKALYIKISKQLIFNAILRVIIQSYLVFLLANAVITSESQNTTLTDSFLHIGSLVCLSLGALFPLAMVVFLSLNSGKINANSSFKDKFSSLYDNLDNTQRKGYVRVPLIYFMRRYLLAMAIVYLKDYPVI